MQFSDHKSGLFSFQRIPQYLIQIPNPRTSDSTALLLVTAGAFLGSGYRSYVSEPCVLLTKSDFPITPLPQKNLALSSMLMKVVLIDEASNIE